MLGRLLFVGLTFFPLAGRACDLCGCYSPQVESMPKEKVSLTGFYTVGPRLIASHDQISGELAAEFPVLMNTTALQAVPDYRLRASVAVSW